jgi:putative transposase
MVVTRVYKTELDLNDRQVTACKRHAGAARFAYNWGLACKREAYQATGKSPAAIDLHRELNALKKSDLPWMYAVSKCAPQEALRNLDVAFASFFRRCQLKKQGGGKGKLGYPRRKTKKQGLGGFRLTGTIAVVADAIQLPRLGRLPLKEHNYLPTSGDHVLSATVAEQAGHWYVSIQVEQGHVVPAASGPVIGVDLGVKRLATLSDGTIVENPHHLQQQLSKITRLHRAVTRKQKGSQNRKKAARRLGAQYRRVANQRANTIHQLSSRLAKTKPVVMIEDLHVSGLLKNHHLAQAIGDAGVGEFRRQLAYKAGWYGRRIIVADRWFASSKTCCRCGRVDEHLTLADRIFRCQHCGLVIDRDLNAARNLEKLADSSSDSPNACGGESADTGSWPSVKRSHVKQEPTTIYGMPITGKVLENGKGVTP